MSAASWEPATVRHHDNPTPNPPAAPQSVETGRSQASPTPSGLSGTSRVSSRRQSLPSPLTGRKRSNGPAAVEVVDRQDVPAIEAVDDRDLLVSGQKIGSLRPVDQFGRV